MKKAAEPQKANLFEYEALKSKAKNGQVANPL